MIKKRGVRPFQSVDEFRASGLSGVVVFVGLFQWITWVWGIDNMGPRACYPFLLGIKIIEYLKRIWDFIATLEDNILLSASRRTGF